MWQRWGILVVVWACVIGMASAARAQEEALCAEVRIEIAQELTLERQGFEAIMRITNSLDSYAIEEIAITVNFTDGDGNRVVATSDTSASDAAFFIRVDETRNVNSLVMGDNGAVTDGVINAGNVGELRWLIVPTANAAGQTDNGELYFVGATLSYAYGGKEEFVQVAPDSIVVKPQPLLTLDYFLTEQVVGDDAFTPEIEPPEPYTLGVRIDNSGFGSARRIKIESAQPTIVDNQQGLAVDFTITKSFVENQPVTPSLLIDFGEIAPAQMKSGRWIMESSLSGKFTSFAASFTHADELGGELTSLIDATNAHLLVKDVLVDLPGRDGVLDFLAYGADSLFVYESEATGADLALCNSCAEVTALKYTLGSETAGTRELTGAAEKGFGLIQVSDPYQGSKSLHAVVRADGKPLAAANFWLSKQRADNDIDFDYFINVFDFSSVASYTLQFVDGVAVPQPPVIRAILDKSSYEGGQVGFLVQSSDPNGSIPQLSSGNLPVGASFIDGGDGTGVFRWQPAIGQAGNYNVRFIASDGVLSTERSVNLRINSAADTDGDGMADAWEMEHFGNLDRDGSGDFDGDGRTDAEEEAVGSNPTLAEVAPGAPKIASPLFDAEILQGADALLPTLTVTNGEHDPALTVGYQFEVYADAAMLRKVAEAQVDEAAETTHWTATTEDLMPEQTFVDNRLYYWRARAITQVGEGSAEVPVASLWVSSRFFINSANDAPSAPVISAPQIDAIVADLRPEMIVSHAFDKDRDLLTYGFDLFHESNLETTIASVSGLLPGSNFQTSWRAPNPLQENSAYLWTAWVEDEHGARTISELGSFLVSTLDEAPSEPVILFPNSVLSSWLPNNGVELRVRNGSDPEQQPLSYYFELDTVASFDSGAEISSAAVAEGQSETAWRVDGLVEDTQYYWRAKVSDGVLESQWVNARFSVDADNTPPPAPSLHNPGADAVVASLRPLFEVNPVVDPDGDTLQYHFEVYTDAALTQLAASQVQVGTQWTADFDLNDNSTYYWRARAEDAKHALSDWSPVNAFAIKASSINIAPEMTLVLPDSEVTVSTPELLIQWQDSDPDSNASIALYSVYEGGDRVLIAGDIAEDPDGTADQYLWDVSTLQPGQYTLEAAISDDETTVTASGCCTITVPEQAELVTVTPLTPLETDETGTLIVRLEVKLKQPLQMGTALTLHLSISDRSEGEILGNSYLQFSADNWDIVQEIQLRGLDDCEIDPGRFNLQFSSVESDDPAYHGYHLDSVPLVNKDNESPGQKLFICHYELIEKTPVNENGEVESHYRARLDNKSWWVESVSARLTLIPSSLDQNYDATVIGSKHLLFFGVPFGGSAFSKNTIAIRHLATQTLDFAKFSWQIDPGITVGDSGDNIIEGTDGADSIQAREGNDILYGRNGDDRLFGEDGDDRLFGEDGIDFLFGGDGDDQLNGGDGSDRLFGGDGNDILIGGAGNDGIYFEGAGSNRFVFSLGDGQDLLTVNRDDPLTGIPVIQPMSKNTVVFGNGIALSDLSLKQFRDELIILVGNNGDQIKISNWYKGEEYQRTSFEFGDGAVYTKEEFLSAFPVVTKNQRLNGGSDKLQ